MNILMKKKNSLCGVKTWFYSQLTDLEHFVANHFGGGVAKQRI